MQVAAQRVQASCGGRRSAACFRPISVSWSRGAALQSLSRQHRHRQQRRQPPAYGRRVVATSEHWWEDEEEFDALTDAMKPKAVVLVAAPASSTAGSDADAAVGALRAYLQPLTFNQAFSSQQALPYAQQLWSGRDKAPYFLKVRTRAALDAVADAAQAAAAAAELWQELLQQNWRVELDAGLGASLSQSEALLVVCSADGVQQLLEAAGAPLPAGSGSVAAGSISVLQVEGTQAGEPSDWQGLGKRLLLAGAVPDGSCSSSESTILEAMDAAAADQPVAAH